MRSDWDSTETSDAWSMAVASGGDVFHRFILKPYVAAAISATVKGQAHETSSIYYKLLSSAATAEPTSGGESGLEALASLFETACTQALNGISSLKILDLGGGEGFLGRWLTPYCERYTIVDVSGVLIDHGIRKARDTYTSCEFFRGDLTELENFQDASHWFENGCERVWAHDDLTSTLPKLSDYDIFLCTNVVDHIERPFFPLRKLSAAMGRLPKRPPLILATLNPDFFVGAKQWPQRCHSIDGSGEIRKVRMGPAARDVDVIPRSWMQVEALLNDAKFNILACDPMHISQYPGRVQQEFIGRAGLQHNPAGGPFVLWHLESADRGKPILSEEINLIFDKYDVLRPLSTKQKDFILSKVSELSKIDFSPDELIAYPSNLPHGFFLVESGEAEMVVRSVRRQVFGSGTAFGELETGRDAFVSRFLYPVRAGPNGCTVVRIERELFSQLLDMDEGRSLGDSLFDLLRDRVSTYSWVYHRSTYTTKNAKRIVRDVSDRDCEALSRILLFAGTMEGGRLRKSLRNATENNGLSVFIRLPTMRDVIAYSIDDHAQSKNTLYSGAIKLFHSIGVIESFDVAGYVRDNNSARHYADNAFQRFLVTALREILVRELTATRRRTSAGLEDVVRKLMELAPADGLPSWPTGVTWSVLKKQIVKSVSDTELVLSSEISSFASSLERRLVSDLHTELDMKHIERAVMRFLYNLAFLRNDFFNRVQPRFFVLNDLYFLRRVAVGTSSWIEELTERAKSSPYVTTDGNVLRPYSRISGYADEWRFDAYLKRFEAFVENYWKAGLDLNYTHDAFLDDKGFVRRSLDQLNLSASI